LNLLDTPLDTAETNKIPIFYEIRPYGVKGELKARSVFPNSVPIVNIKILSDDSGQEYDSIIKPHGSEHFIIQLSKVKHRDQAEKLKEQKLYADAAEIYRNINLDDISAYGFFIMDFMVSTKDDPKLGEVIGIHNFGAGDLLEVFCFAKGATFFYPFQKEFIAEINFSKRNILINEDYKNFT
jgi:16S rRNA processing protein RimM